MYQKTDNIYTSIIMHIFHNTALTTLSLIGGAMILLWKEKKKQIS